MYKQLVLLTLLTNLNMSFGSLNIITQEEVEAYTTKNGVKLKLEKSKCNKKLAAYSMLTITCLTSLFFKDKFFNSRTSSLEQENNIPVSDNDIIHFRLKQLQETNSFGYILKSALATSVIIPLVLTPLEKAAGHIVSKDWFSLIFSSKAYLQAFLTRLINALEILHMNVAFSEKMTPLTNAENSTDAINDSLNNLRIEIIETSATLRALGLAGYEYSKILSICDKALNQFNDFVQSDSLNKKINSLDNNLRIITKALKNCMADLS